MTCTTDPVALLSDPDWYPHRYDAQRDLFHLIPATREMRGKAVFLTDEYLGDAPRRAVPVARAAVAGATSASGAQHYFLHSAFCCSMLLANAFERQGLATTLKEPVILNDLSGWRRRGGSARGVAACLGDVLSALGASTPPGEALILKPSNVTIALAPAMLALRPEARAVLLHAPLETFVASVASKGMWGRLWVRDLWVKLAADGLCNLGFDQGASMGWTDLQVAAMGWLAQHRLFAQIVDRFGARIATLDSVSLLKDPARTVEAIAHHFQLSMDAGTAQEIAAGPVFTRNAKTGDRFGPQARDAIHAAARNAHRDEVEKVVAWTRAVAQANDISLALEQPLLG